MFFLAAGFYAAGSIFFAIFADGELQDWNEPKSKDSEKGETYSGRRTSVTSGDFKKFDVVNKDD